MHASHAALSRFSVVVWGTTTPARGYTRSGARARGSLREMPERRRLLVVVAGALALLTVFAVYSPSAARTLVRDDNVVVAENAPFPTASPLALLTKPFLPDDPLADARVRYYRPIVLLSLRADVALGGSRAEFHFTNVMLHAVA